MDGGGGLFGRTPTDVGLFTTVVGLEEEVARDFDVEYLPLLPNFIITTTTTTTTTAIIRPIMSKAPMIPPAIAPAAWRKRSLICLYNYT